MNTIDTFILIGGRSSRMGEPKHLIEIGGYPMLDITVSFISEALPQSNIKLVVSSDEQHESGKLGVVKDVHRGRGAWSGVHAALSNSFAEWTFITACDYPLMPALAIERLADHCLQNNDAVIPIQHDGRPQPLCAFYRTAVCLDVAGSILLGAETPPMRAMFDKVRTKFVEFAELNIDERSFVNVNSRNDLDKARSLFDAGERVVAK